MISLARLALVLAIGCGSSNDAAVDADAGPRGTAYTGRVILSSDLIRVDVDVVGDGCNCERDRPVAGSCDVFDDNFNRPCDCAPCLERIDVTGDDADVSIGWDDFLGMHSGRLHQATPGQQVTIELIGCLGRATFTGQVPLPEDPVTLSPPVAANADHTRVDWTPDARFDEVYVSDSGDFVTAACVSDDTGTATLPKRTDLIFNIYFEGIELAETVDTGTGSIDLYAGQTARWSPE